MRKFLRILGVLAAVFGVLLLLLCSGMGAFFLLESPYYLALGWIYYLVRVVPQVRPDPAAVGTAVVCLAVVTLGCHLFARWLHAHVRPESPAWSWRWTARGVAVVILLFVAGTAAVGVVHQTAWLATAKEKLLTGGVREASAKMTSNNNMKQMGLAAHNHADPVGYLPTSTFAPDGRPMHSWQTALLSFIEQEHVYRKFQMQKPWSHPENLPAIQSQIKVFLHPGVDHWPAPDSTGLSHYAANVFVLGGDRPRRLAEFEAKGTSNVILFGEAVANPRPWADPLNWRDPRLPLGHPRGFGGPAGQKGTQFCFADGSVRAVDPADLRDLLK